MAQHPHINETEVEFLYKDFGIKDVKSRSKISIEASIANVLKVAWERERGNPDIHDKLNAVIDFMSSNKLISYQRPKTTSEAKDTTDYIYEEITAYKLYLPKIKLKDFSEINEIIVWVADPELTDLSEELWAFKGTFLYLISTLYDRAEFLSTLSGCSALQALSNIATGKHFYTIDWEEPLGRANHMHPIEKLKNIGAINLGKQNIKTLYRKRYITNEQCCTFNQKEYRCNDLLGYPLFIV